ncbi:hypothetical protein [Streptomyces sp. NBC_00986]|uniref:hypothetical protein n=1 Tax=Streptomyces sp. NBC_00986 TaxID=2903702 RepID=UPI0038661805|nr:hypothetical protein OG504_02190 [Streptomyces sp. NBC_00986]
MSNRPDRPLDPSPDRTLGRRQLLRVSVGATALAGLAMTGIAPARATVGAGTERTPALPPVPGMLGDRRANEVWYQLDEVALYKASPELIAAYQAIGLHVGGNIEGGVRTVWQEMSKSPEYPGNYRAFMAPVEEPLRVISDIQLGVFDSLYRPYDPRLVAAFAYFGQGVLYDPRRESVRSPVHTMDSPPGGAPVAYHTWYAYMRAMMLLDIDRPRWTAFAPLNAYAWALQSVAKPSTQTPSPPLPRETVVRFAATWLPRGPRRLDADFQSFPYPRGIS